MELLEIRDVSKVYERNVVALNRVNFEVNKGEFVVLVGPCGAGKTTLLKLVLIEEAPTEGEILVDHFSSLDIKKQQIPLLRRKIGVIFQDLKLLEDRNVFDNVALPLWIRKQKPKKIKKKVLSTLAQVGITHKSKCFPHQLSLGELQKVAIARAIVHDPVMVLADEPTGNLDPKSSLESIKMLKDTNLNGTTVLLATHDFRLAKDLSCRTIHIEKGRLVNSSSQAR